MAKQLIYLDFDGGSELAYENGEYSVSGIDLAPENYTAEEKAQMLSELQARFADADVEFTLTTPQNGEYSTIYIGETDAFDIYSAEAKGISETTGESSSRLDDNAFVLTQNIGSLDELISVIAHEAGHIAGLLEHSGDGIAKFALYDQVYVNGNLSYSSGNVYNLFSQALNNVSADGTVTVIGGSFLSDVAFNNRTGIWQNGSCSKSVSSTQKVTSAALTYNGNLSFTVSGGTIADYYTAYGSSNYSYTVNGDVSLNLSGGKSGQYICGAGRYAKINGDVSIGISGEAQFSVIAGTGVESSAQNVNIQIDGGVSGTIFGAGYGNGGQAGSVTVTMNGGTISNDIAIGGYGESGYVGAAKAYINDGKIGSISATQNGVVDDCYIRIRGGEVGRVYGGGTGYSIGSVKKSVIDVSGVAQITALYGGGAAAVNAATVNIAGGTIGTVYGGGYYYATSNTKSASINIADGNITGNVYGGGERGATAGVTVVTITGGIIGGNVYGGSLFNGTSAITESGTHSYEVKITQDNIAGNIFGGLCLSTTGGYSGEANSTVSIQDASGKLFVGGSYVTSTAEIDNTITGTSKLSFFKADGEGDIHVTQYAAAGSLVGGKVRLNIIGNSELNISSGSFDYLVSGGGMIQSASASLTQTGDTAVNISGGTFGGNIYGGHISTKLAYAINTTLNGNTSITVNSAVNAVNIGGSNIFGGSNGNGVIMASTSIVFSGLGSNLTFSGIVSGESSGAGTYKGQRLEYVSGDRSLAFSGFLGDFNGSAIMNIDTFRVLDGSSANMTAVNDLSEVNNWDFSYNDGQSAALTWSNANGINDFTGDTLDITGEGTSLSLDGWTVLDGTAAGHIAGWNQLGSVTLFGQAASFDSDLSCWASSDYQLFADTDNHDLIVTKIA